MATESHPIGRGEAITILAGEKLTPHGKGRGGYWRWYQRLERERAAGRLRAQRRPGHRELYFDRQEIQRLAAELSELGVKTARSRRRVQGALRVRMERRGLMPLPTAAAQLGLKPASLRNRIQRGTIEGVRVDGQWFLTPGTLDTARPRRAAATAGRELVRCDLPGCDAERLLTASQRAASERHFCSNGHRLEWLRIESQAGRITRRGRPDGPDGRRHKSAALARSWQNGERDVNQIRELGEEAAWTRSKKSFATRIDKMTRTRYHHGLTDERMRELAGRALSRAQRGSERSIATRQQEQRLRQLWPTGGTVKEIAEDLGTTESNVKEMRRRLGLPQRAAGRRSQK